jgi:HlyD family secretion protein
MVVWRQLKSMSRPSLPGDLSELVPREGDMVVAGAVVARLDADDLRAQLRATEAQVLQAQQALDEKRAGVRKSKADVALAGKTLKRSEESGWSSGFISRRASLIQIKPAWKAQWPAWRRRKVGLAKPMRWLLPPKPRVDGLKVALNDSSLKAPISGRVLYRLAEPGEVLAAGGKVLTLLDLSDMFMTIFLPTDKAGQVMLGSEARIVLDALPGQAVPATVSFVAPKAQFTPREVETRTEREKLMFRIKVKADPAWLAAHRDLAKGGMPGVAYVRLDANVAWPANLQINGK